MPTINNTHFQSLNSNLSLDSEAADEDDAKNWTKIPGKDDLPEYDVYSAPIRKSSSDERSYRIVKLSNGLEAILVHDPTTELAGASLDVAVGYLSDPVSLVSLCDKQRKQRMPRRPQVCGLHS